MRTYISLYRYLRVELHRSVLKGTLYSLSALESLLHALYFTLVRACARLEGTREDYIGRPWAVIAIIMNTCCLALTASIKNPYFYTQAYSQSVGNFIYKFNTHLNFAVFNLCIYRYLFIYKYDFISLHLDLLTLY